MLRHYGWTTCTRSPIPLGPLKKTTTTQSPRILLLSPISLLTPPHHPLYSLLLSLVSLVPIRRSLSYVLRRSLALVVVVVAVHRSVAARCTRDRTYIGWFAYLHVHASDHWYLYIGNDVVCHGTRKEGRGKEQNRERKEKETREYLGRRKERMRRSRGRAIAVSTICMNGRRW